jgi:hypothetical protein
MAGVKPLEMGVLAIQPAIGVEHVCQNVHAAQAWVGARLEALAQTGELGRL